MLVAVKERLEFGTLFRQVPRLLVVNVIKHTSDNGPPLMLLDSLHLGTREDANDEAKQIPPHATRKQEQN